MPSEVITERGKTLFDVSAGICFSAGRWYGGFSAMHLAQPYLTSSQNETNRLRRLFTVNAGGEIPVRQGKLLIRPHAALLTQHDRLIIQSGLSVSYRELLLGLSVWNIRSGFFVVEPSAGWKTGIVTFTISYNYNIAGNYDYLQGAAIVKAGVKISVNNVEKRKPVHIINIPEL